MSLLLLAVLALASFVLLDVTVRRDAPRHVSQGFNGAKPREWGRTVRDPAARRLLEANGIR